MAHSVISVERYRQYHCTACGITLERRMFPAMQAVSGGMGLYAHPGRKACLNADKEFLIAVEFVDAVVRTKPGTGLTRVGYGG